MIPNQDLQDNGPPHSGPLSLDSSVKPRRRAFLIAWCIFALIAFVGFIALGTWQVERRTWKLALIERVETRVHAPTVPAPAKADWPMIAQDTHEYLHVRTEGRFMHESATYVEANAALGPGFWVLVPLQQDDGTLVLINRGFVADKQAYRPVGDAVAVVDGLLRLSEPHGRRLRKNEPEQERWFSRDVEAIARARGLPMTDVAPYFIDADATASPVAGEPVGGLTVISFYNHHLVYALTWYTLALMVAGATVYLLREEYKKSRS